MRHRRAACGDLIRSISHIPPSIPLSCDAAAVVRPAGGGVRLGPEAQGGVAGAAVSAGSGGQGDPHRPTEGGRQTLEGGHRAGRPRALSVDGSSYGLCGPLPVVSMMTDRPDPGLLPPVGGWVGGWLLAAGSGSAGRAGRGGPVTAPAAAAAGEGRCRGAAAGPGPARALRALSHHPATARPGQRRRQAAPVAGAWGGAWRGRGHVGCHDGVAAEDQAAHGAGGGPHHTRHGAHR